jgi:hypothetical protein
MRVNVYAEELRDVTDEDGARVTLIHKQVVPGFTHSAVQILLGERVIHTVHGDVKDDDTSAIKFWYADEYQRGLLEKILEKALQELRRPEAKK